MNRPLTLGDFADSVTTETLPDLLHRLATESKVKSYQDAILRGAAETLGISADVLLADFQKNHTIAPVDHWQFFSLKDAYSEREPIRYIIDGIFSKGSLNIVYGPPASFKSMLVADAFMCACSGRNWLGRDVEQVPTLWLDLDNGKRRSHERFEALARALNLPESVPFNYVSMPTPWLNAGNISDVEALEKRIKDRGVLLVCIDNLGLISPSADENSDDMVLVMGHLRLLAERTNAAIILIHHQRKGNGKNNRAGESLRGHSSIEAAVDLALRIDREDGSNIITIRSTKSRDVEVPPFAAKYNFEHKADSSELSKAWFSGFEVEDRTSDKAIEKAILNVVRDNSGLTQAQVVDAIKAKLQAGVNRIRGVYNEMKSKGQLNSQGE